MKALVGGFMGLAIFAAVLPTLSTTAYALGGCGFNGHRNYYGRCVFGGQNQNYCLRRTGHPAVYVGRGIYRCF